MKKVAKNLIGLIGHTPLMELSGYSAKYGLEGNIVAKLEAFNPAGSVKDRVALSMIEDAEERGLLKPGATIIEPTSGNTGVGLAMVATIKGYRLILTMPETMSLERRNLLKALGAQIVLTDGMAGMKKHNPDVYVMAVEPAASPVLAGGVAAPHRIQGIGANFIPKIYDASVVDEVMGVPDDEAIRAGRELAATEGLLAGISSGAAVYAARKLAERPEFAGKMIVALLPDTGERYLSTELFAFDAYPLD